MWGGASSHIQLQCWTLMGQGQGHADHHACLGSTQMDPEHNVHNSPRVREPYLYLPSVPFLLSMPSTLARQRRW
uniref:Uncharacterized protein n=1 Tax=Anguilla anguilla TaxID=7936 RepID=A0A0E9RKM2_ANGAN